MVALLGLGYPPFERAWPGRVKLDILEALLYGEDRFLNEQERVGLLLVENLLELAILLDTLLGVESTTILFENGVDSGIFIADMIRAFVVRLRGVPHLVVIWFDGRHRPAEDDGVELVVAYLI